MAQRSVKSRFTFPDREDVTCPFCGQEITARWTSNTEVEVISQVCPHYMGHDRTVFYFFQQGSEPLPWDWNPEKTYHHN